MPPFSTFYGGKMIRINVMTAEFRNTLSQRRWRERNPIKARKMRLESNRAWRKRATEQDRERNRESSLVWSRNHPDRRLAVDRKQRAIRSKAEGHFTAESFKTLGNVCVCCGVDESGLSLLGRRLVPDHVVPLSKGGTNYISNIQPLCHGKGGCNNIKGTKCLDFRR
jgi:hypothetical protein